MTLYSYITSSVELHFCAASGNVVQLCEQELLSSWEKIAVFKSFFN